MQVKLLRALQDGEIDPVGARKPVRVDFRLISATNRSLIDLVKEGRFREDLYYRLNVFPIRVPPLRERREDIAELVRHFIARFAAEEGKAFIRGFSAEALDLLLRYDWPGNVRQLENAVFRGVCSPTPAVSARPSSRRWLHHVEGAAPVAGGLGAARPAQRGVDRRLLSGPLEPSPAEDGFAFDASGDVPPARRHRGADDPARTVPLRRADDRGAAKLGIGRSTLYRKLKDLGLE